MKSFSIISLLAGSIFIISCNEDATENVPTTVVQFAAPTQLVLENAGSQTVSIIFDKPAAIDGTLKIQFDATLEKHFLTDPVAKGGVVTLPFSKMASGVSFSLTPVNNVQFDGARAISFQISASTGFKAGENHTFTLTIQDDESPNSLASFITTNAELSESYGEAFQISIQVSEAPTANGSIILSATSEQAVYNTHYTTEPAFVNNELTLMVEPGTSVVSFLVRPIDNNLISGHQSIKFAIKSTSGNIQKGIALEDNLQIKDDELVGMPKGYEIGAGTWGLRKTLEYNADGNVSKVHWESNTPYSTTGTDTYFYNDQKQLTKINKYAGVDLYYIYEGNRIVKEEKIDHGVLKHYIEYAYDDAGNVGGYRVFYLQPDGSYALSMITVLLYYTDGNLYKKMVYVPSEDPNEPYLSSVTTIESYREEENHYPVIEVMPNLNTQKKLPSRYRHETPEHDLVYNFTYEFRNDGKVSKRITTGPSTETAVYNYY